MTPYEVMLSESQERMLIIVRKGHEDDVAGLFERWEVPWAIIGHVTDDSTDPHHRRRPRSRRPPRRRPRRSARIHPRRHPPARARRAGGARPDRRCPTSAVNRAAHPTTSSSTSSPRPTSPPSAGSTASTTRGPHEHRRRGRLGRRRPAHQRARRRASPSPPTATAATATSTPTPAARWPSPRPRATSPAPARSPSPSPTASTSATRSARRLLPDAGGHPRHRRRLRELGTPVISGNVSLYNETEERAVYPTPVIGMLGILDDVTRHRRMAFAAGRRRRLPPRLPRRAAASNRWPAAST